MIGYKRFILTLYSPLKSSASILSMIGRLSSVKYCVFQYCLNRTNNTVYIQMCLEFTKFKSLYLLKKYFSHSYILPSVGTRTQAINYCTREDVRLPGTFIYLIKKE